MASGPRGNEPDYRFTLANERTFLAYIRTALGLDAGGLAIDQFVNSSRAFRLTLAIAVIVLAMVVAGFGYLRWRETEQAMRLDRPLPPIRLPLILAGSLIALSVVAIALLASR